MVHQINLASAPYERGVDEFVKSGLTKRPSQLVAPPGVAESPFIMEARLLQHLTFGNAPGSANMMVCEVVMIHVADDLFTATGGIDPHRIDPVGRLMGAYYTRAKEGLFVLPQPTAVLVGVDALPEEIRTSPILTGRHLAQLATVEQLPTSFVAQAATLTERHTIAVRLLDQGELTEAWQALVAARS